MGNNIVHIAIDFGGGSGRVVADWLSSGILQTREIYRFPNHIIKLGGHEYWDFLYLFEEMKKGIRKAVEDGLEVISIGIDTWGVDYALVDKQSGMINNPFSYRDDRSKGYIEKVFPNKNSIKNHYGVTGIQMIPINTLYQLISEKEEFPWHIQHVEHLLFMPDLFNYYLTGKACNEYTIASTSELLKAQERTWNYHLIDKLNLPRRIFGEIIMPGTSIGKVLPEIRRELGLNDNVEVIAVASHDTASAISSLPAFEILS